ncbi:MAG: hypothetical protein ABIZ36_01305 [Gemmatimonadaceae bacterium]
MNFRPSMGLVGLLLAVAACAPAVQMETVALVPQPVGVTSRVINSVDAGYQPVTEKSAEILGCAAQANAAVCEIALPTAEEDSAFNAEGTRLVVHADPRCRKLGTAILENDSTVRMYRKALIRYSGDRRLYGVGHTYEIDDTWFVRVARRLDDLNERTLDDKKRTLRHEMSHTLGATEDRANGWSAEDYARACT